MVIRNLKGCSLAEIMECFERSFSDYFVKMNFDIEYWKMRFEAARVDYELSYGIFNNGKLIAFIINGVDSKDNIKTAYNTGTGVLPEYRGNHFVDKLYAHAIPVLKSKGIGRFLLEVITDNQIAVHVYERIGFKKTRLYRCYKGELQLNERCIFKTAIIPNQGIGGIKNEFHHFYSWDNCNEAISKANGQYKIVKVSDTSDTDIGFFVINSDNGYLAQFEVFAHSEDNWKNLFSAISAFSKSVSIKNVDENRATVIDALEKAGLSNYINQYEMEMY